MARGKGSQKLAQ